MSVLRKVHCKVLLHCVIDASESEFRKDVPYADPFSVEKQLCERIIRTKR